VVVYRLIFAIDGKTLLDAHVFERGRGDALDTVEVIGGQAAIRYSVESAARGLGRSGARQRSDYDQRLINPDDGYFKNTGYAPEKMLYWGGKKPSRTGTAVGGSTSGSSSTGVYSDEARRRRADRLPGQPPGPAARMGPGEQRLRRLILAAVEAQTGIAVAPELTWSTKREALRVIKRFGSLEAAFDAHFERIAPARQCAAISAAS
jgi:hypothetical protein